MSKRGVVLAVSMVIMLVLLVLIGVFFWGALSENRSVNSEKFVVQSLALAEAGANHSLAELKRLTNIQLPLAVGMDMSYKFKNYFSSNNSLAVLTEYLGFTTQNCPGGACYGISASSADLSGTFTQTAIEGNYNSLIRVVQNGNPEKFIQGGDERYIFHYSFFIQSTGSITRVIPNIQRIVKLSGGNFDIIVRRDNFAKYALFTSHHTTPGGTTVWFTSNTNFTGPVSTNDRFSFAQNPGAHFTELVTQHQDRARYYNNNNPLLLDADYNSYINHSGQEIFVDKPTFDKGFQRSEAIINLPSAVSQADLKKEAMGSNSDNFSNGINLPNDGTKLTGGIYIKGNQGQQNDNAIIGMATGANGPVYTIQQGVSNPVTVEVNYSANSGVGSTTVTSNSTSKTYAGIPDGADHQGILIYVNDDIGYKNGSVTQGLSGTVNKDSQVTVSSERDIVISGNVKYEQYNSAPLSAQGYNNVLGILSWGGNVRIGTAAPNNVEIHGVVMAPTGIFTVDNYDQGSPRGVATLLGGAITDFYGAFGTFSGSSNVSGYGRNFVYDARMLEGVSPPYFPYLKDFTTSVDGLKAGNRYLWQDEGA